MNPEEFRKNIELVVGKIATLHDGILQIAVGVNPKTDLAVTMYYNDDNNKHGVPAIGPVKKRYVHIEPAENVVGLSIEFYPDLYHPEDQDIECLTVSDTNYTGAAAAIIFCYLESGDLPSKFMR